MFQCNPTHSDKKNKYLQISFIPCRERKIHIEY